MPLAGVVFLQRKGRNIIARLKGSNFASMPAIQGWGITAEHPCCCMQARVGRGSRHRAAAAPRDDERVEVVEEPTSSSLKAGRSSSSRSSLREGSRQVLRADMLQSAFSHFY